MKTPTRAAAGARWPRASTARVRRAASRAELLFIILANIGTTITPWQIFFQQSAVVDKGLDIHDIKFGKIDTFVGSLLTCLVAAFIIIATGGGVLLPPPADRRSRTPQQTAEALVPLLPARRRGELARQLFAIGLFDAGFLGALCISLSTSLGGGRGLRLGPLAQQERARRALVLRRLPGACCSPPAPWC